MHLSEKKYFSIFALLLLGMTVILNQPSYAQTIHVLAIIMDGDVNIGISAEKDSSTLEKCLSSLESWKLCDVNSIFLKSSKMKVTSKDVLNWINDCEVSSNDTLMIYYSGHGFIDEQNRHFLWFDEGNILPRSEIISEMQKHNCRLKILITDSCSNLVILPAPVTATPRSLGENRDKQYYKNLFLEHKGLLDITAASEGEYAWGNSTIGGYFTSSLFSAFSGEGNAFRSWQEVFSDAKKGTLKLFEQTIFSPGDEQRMEAKGISGQNPKAYALPEIFSNQMITSVSQQPSPPIISPIMASDDNDMVLIPAGEFEMGIDRSEIPELLEWSKGYDATAKAGWFEDETPRHRVYLDAFYIDKYEVTNAQYKKFMEATGHNPPEFWDDPKYNHPEQPVVGVSWDDANAYCKWAGKRLPTEAEWEKSARGGLIGKRFPWGDEPSHDYANYAGTVGNDIWSGPSPVGSFAPNNYGLYDMAGNVFEWCADWYDKNYYSKSPKDNPKGPVSGTTKVVRGGGFGYTANNLRVSDRFGSYFPNRKYPLVGFRCAKDAVR